MGENIKKGHWRTVITLRWDGEDSEGGHLRVVRIFGGVHLRWMKR